MPTQIFLGDEIIGPNVADAAHLTFERCDINKDPSYNRRFFESAPTMWACAYELEKLIATYLRPPSGTEPTIDNEQAVEEWLCLFAFYYFGVANLELFSESVFVNRDSPTPTYDPDLWSALSLTYPPGTLSEIALLRINDDQRTVLGASYPGIVFFPGRGRAAWSKSLPLRKFLVDNKLSWKNCERELFGDQEKRNDFAKFLADAKATVGGDCGEAITKFTSQRGLELPGNGTTFRLKYPYQEDSGWTRAIVEDKDKIIAKYPLVNETKDNEGRVTRRVYFLVTGPMDANGQREEGIPDTDWTEQYIYKGMPSAKQFYLKKDESGNLRRDHIFIKWAGKEFKYELKEIESVVLLAECFQKRPAYWCQVPQDATFSAHLRAEHQVSNSDQSAVLNKQANGNSFHLVPVTDLFLKNFGFNSYEQSQSALIKILSITRSSVDVNDGDVVQPGMEWQFRVSLPDRTNHQQQREFTLKWTGAIEKRVLEDVSLAVWPPSVHRDWRLYFGYGRGSGVWRLFDENGDEAAQKTKAEEFLSISGQEDIHRVSPNRPAAAMFFESDNKPRGVFFLKNLEEVGAVQGEAELGFDFGTSNTCLAFKLAGAQRPQVLRFTLTPKMIWGRTPAELPGFVPFKWQDKDFFSTILLTDAKKHDIDQIPAANIKPSDLFLDVDIPTLHQGLKESLAFGRFAQSWNVHHDLKWKKPAILRDIFLSLTLLYAQAELLFNPNYRYKLKQCVFTYPLSFDNERILSFQTNTREVYQRIYRLCYAKTPEIRCGFKNESEAVAASQAASEASIDLFIDIGGGSTDIAVSHPELELSALDSVELAGNKFFEIIWQHMSGDEPSKKQLRLDLNQLLNGVKQELNVTRENAAYLEKIGGLGSFYSFLISERDPKDLAESEREVRKVPGEYYQHFRARWFYEHILAYSLIQVCAAAITNERLPRDIRILCTGNGWGMLTLAKWAKTEHELRELAEGILDLIKKKLKGRPGVSDERLASLQIGKVAFIGEDGSERDERIRHTAKTAVACGAIESDTDESRPAIIGDASSFTGVNLEEVVIGEKSMGSVSIPTEWKDRWQYDRFAKPLKEAMNATKLTQVGPFQFSSKNSGEPFDSLLEVFFNTYKIDKQWVERMWRDLNDMTLLGRAYPAAKDGRMPPSPLNRFLAEALYGQNRSNLRELTEKLDKR